MISLSKKAILFWTCNTSQILRAQQKLIGLLHSSFFSEMQIADYFQSEGAHSDEFAVGLQDAFQPVAGHDIGQFPGTNYGEQISKSPITVAV